MTCPYYCLAFIAELFCDLCRIHKIVNFVVLHCIVWNKPEYFEYLTGVLVHKSRVANYSVKG